MVDTANADGPYLEDRSDALQAKKNSRDLPSGWWVLPGAAIGLGMWIGLFMMIF